MQVNREIKIPLYMQVYESLMEMICQKKWRAGELLPSERELSLMFNVDRLTVRRALAMIAQEGLVEKIAGLGTRVMSASIRPKENHNFRNLIFLLPAVSHKEISAVRITDPFKADLFFSVENECKKKGYNLIYTTIGDDEDLTEVLEGRGICGIFFVSKIHPKFLDEAIRLNFPAVVLNNQYDLLPSIQIAHEKGAYEAVKYLIGLNHRHISFITGIPGYITARDGFEGYKRALADADIDWKTQIVKEGDWTFDSGFKAMKEILGEVSSPPSAVFACNDMMAIGAMEAIKAAGYSVPKDISVLGFDGIEQSQQCYPTLTTLKVNVATMAAITCQSLFAAIESQQLQNIQILLPAELVIRESTAPAKEHSFIA